jgi:hypothetical protein
MLMKMNCGTLWAVLALSCALFLAHTEANLNPRRQSYDQAYWFDPAYDLTLSVVVPLAKRQASSNQSTYFLKTLFYHIFILRNSYKY